MNRSAEKEERETTIILAEGKAQVWTSDLVVFHKLQRLGFTLTSDNEKSAWFGAPAKCISFRRAGVYKNVQPLRKKMTEEHKAALQKGRLVRQNQSNRKDLAT